MSIVKKNSVLSCYSQYFGSSWIYRLYVRPKDRRKGIAKKLVSEEIIKLKKARPFKPIRLYVCPFSSKKGMNKDQLINFYKTFGFKMTHYELYGCPVMELKL